MTRTVEQVVVPVPQMEEKHYKPAELAAMWGFSAGTVRRLIKDELGVLRLEGMGESVGRRKYVTYSIPASVAARVHQRLSQQPLQAATPRRHKRCIVLLRNHNRRVS
jgi:hypothetical protein